MREELPERYFYNKNKIIKIGQILKDVFPKRSNTDKISQRVKNTWKCVVDDEIYRSTNVTYLKNGILYVVVESAVMIHYLTNFKKADIIKGINEIMGMKYIEDIRFKIGIL